MWKVLNQYVNLIACCAVPLSLYTPQISASVQDSKAGNSNLHIAEGALLLSFVRGKMGRAERKGRRKEGRKEGKPA